MSEVGELNNQGSSFQPDVVRRIQVLDGMLYITPSANPLEEYLKPELGGIPLPHISKGTVGTIAVVLLIIAGWRVGMPNPEKQPITEPTSTRTVTAASDLSQAGGVEPTVVAQLQLPEVNSTPTHNAVWISPQEHLKAWGFEHPEDYAFIHGGTAFVAPTGGLPLLSLPSDGDNSWKMGILPGGCSTPKPHGVIKNRKTGEQWVAFSVPDFGSEVWDLGIPPFIAAYAPLP